jgi:hypothetical protein
LLSPAHYLVPTGDTQLKKFSLYIPSHTANAIAACAKANGMAPSTLMRIILERGIDQPISIKAPRKAAR